MALKCTQPLSPASMSLLKVEHSIIAYLSSLPPLLEGLIDHGALERQLTLSASQSRQCFNITITDDGVAEEDELFQLTLSSIGRTSANFVPFQVLIPLATVTIIDNDCKA